MDVANQVNGLVIGTGDLSNWLWDGPLQRRPHVMYAVNTSIPKTLVRYLVQWVATHGVDNDSRKHFDIIDTPISPELIPADENGNIKQITEDLVGPYELHDFFLYYFMRFGFRPSKIFSAIAAFEEYMTVTPSRNGCTRSSAVSSPNSSNVRARPTGRRWETSHQSPRRLAHASDASSAGWLEEIEALKPFNSLFEGRDKQKQGNANVVNRRDLQQALPCQ